MVFQRLILEVGGIWYPGSRVMLKVPLAESEEGDTKSPVGVVIPIEVSPPPVPEGSRELTLVVGFPCASIPRMETPRVAPTLFLE
jgi:hypothetical protein